MSPSLEWSGFALHLALTVVAGALVEGETDELLDRGLKALFQGESSAGHKLNVEKVYGLIEAVVDRCEGIVGVIDGIVVEQV